MSVSSKVKNHVVISVEKVGRLFPDNEKENIEGFTIFLITVLLSFENNPKEIGFRIFEHADNTT